MTDPESGLEGSLTILDSSDGGVSAVVVALHNPSAEHDVVLMINDETSAFIMLTVTDDEGNVLSAPAKKFNTAETQRFDKVRIERGSSADWRVPIAAQLAVGAIPERGIEGRLVVNVALVFNKVSGDDQPADQEFTSSLLTLYDMHVSFTQAALRDDTAPPDSSS